MNARAMDGTREGRWAAQDVLRDGCAHGESFVSDDVKMGTLKVAESHDAIFVCQNVHSLVHS